MVDKREKKLFGKLIKNYGFYVEEYGRTAENLPLNVAVKYTDKGVIGIIVTDSYQEDKNVKELSAFLYGKNQPVSLNVVVYSSYAGQPASGIAYNRVVVDSYTSKVLSYTEGGQFLVNLLNDSSTRNRSFSRKKSWVTLTIIAINVIIFLITAYYSGSIFDIDNYVLYLFGAKENYSIAHGEYYRLLTAAFLHGGLTHIALNMYSLYIVGSLVERVYGKLRYTVIYLISALTSSYLSYLMSEYLSVGASGAIFGLLGAALIYAYKERSKIGRDFLRNIISVIAINVFIGLSISNIDNFGHIGGLIGGLICGALLYQRGGNI